MTYNCERSGVLAGKHQDKLVPDPVLSVGEAMEGKRLCASNDGENHEIRMEVRGSMD